MILTQPKQLNVDCNCLLSLLGLIKLCHTIWYLSFYLFFVVVSFLLSTRTLPEVEHDKSIYLGDEEEWIFQPDWSHCSRLRATFVAARIGLHHCHHRIQPRNPLTQPNYFISYLSFIVILYLNTIIIMALIFYSNIIFVMILPW